MTFDKTRRVFYDEEAQVFQYPTPDDPQYCVSIDLFRSRDSILHDVALHLRDKHGTSDEQLVDLLCCAAAVLD